MVTQCMILGDPFNNYDMNIRVVIQIPSRHEQTSFIYKGPRHKLFITCTFIFSIYICMSKIVNKLNTYFEYRNLIDTNVINF